ncbi:MAG: PKD domain-containing protein [Bacteroidales bacterium]|nr:PKD domain-containing protein [Bacteroidales bacterium]
MRKLQFIFFVLLLFFFACENDEDHYQDVQIDVDIKYHNVYGRVVFNSIPLEFRCELRDTLKEFPYLNLEWDLDDGDISNERSFLHTYNKNGTYNPELTLKCGEVKVSYGRNGSANEYPFNKADDFHFKVTNYPKIYGKDESNEVGHFIYASDLNYSIFYSKVLALKNIELYLKKIDNNLNEVSNTKLDFEPSDSVLKSFKNTDGNIVVITNNNFYEYTLSGVLICKKQKLKNYFSVIKYLEGYSAVIAENGNIRIDILDSEFKIKESNIIEFDNSDSKIIDIEPLKSGGYMVLCSFGYYYRLFQVDSEGYYNEFNDNVVDINQIENVFEIDGFNYVIGRYIASNFISTVNFFVYSNYESSYTYDRDYRYNLFSSYSKSHLSASFLLIGNKAIYSNMQFGIRDLNNDLRFGNDYDYFNDAVINDQGNYVILGTKQTAINKTQDENIECKTDLLLIEIDNEGNPINYSKLN